MECCAHTTGKETETQMIREFSQGDVKPGLCDSKVCPSCKPEGEVLFLAVFTTPGTFLSFFVLL